ncbi:MAG TPA: NnrS family protein [Thiolinea sp.]|nr:NnrS family protein [Thiolinea sp.]
MSQPAAGHPALLRLGFRPFFLGAGAFAVVGMALWMAMYGFGWTGLSPAYLGVFWHGHEMVFGYAVAVAAGFLLTAIRNWTGLQTVHQWPLMVLAGLWLLARLLPLTGAHLLWTVGADLGFMAGLLVAAALPVIRTRQWVQAGIISKLLLLLLANAVFYLGVLGVWPAGVMVGLYAGFYLILALILTMGRRVIPFFIERGIDSPFKARNNLWIDRASLALFLVFAVAQVTALGTGHVTAAWIAAWLALVQAVLHAVRLWGWHHRELWRRPLLWVLFLAYGWLILGFVLTFLAQVGMASFWLALHAFGVGGIGMMTVGMMARVILGHTGRNVFEPPPVLTALFLLLLGAAVLRVFPVWWWPSLQLVWVIASQLVWMVAFLLFLRVYAPMLVQPRVDGRDG